MRSNIPFIQHRAEVMRATNGPACDIVVSWREWTVPPTVDPVTKSKTGGTSAIQSQVIRGHVHYVQPAMTQYRAFNEIEVGDAIVEVAPDLELSGRDELTFTISEKKWVQKTISDRLAETWDALLGNERIEQTLLLRKAA